MSAITQVTGAAWPTSGAATNSTIGVNAITGTITHVGTTNVPPNSGATGVLRMTENSAAAIRVDALASVAPVLGNHYWLRFWVRGVKTGSPLASQSFSSLVAYDSTRILGFQFRTNADGTIGWTPFRSESGIAGGTQDDVMVEGTEPVIPWGLSTDNEGWAEIVIHVERHGSTGVWEIYLNGVIFGYHIGINTDQLWTTGLTAGSWNLNFPAWTGMYWEVSGPIESYNGTDITVTPQLTRIPTGALATKLFPVFATKAASGSLSLTQGKLGVASGTGTVTVDTEYLNQAGSPCRHRLLFSGDGNSPTWTTLFQVGTLPYNEQGWAALAISDLLVPTTGSSKGIATWVINDTGGSALWSFQINGGTIFGAYTTGPYVALGTWTHATARYCLILHLNRDGRAAMTYIDLTTSPGAATNALITTSHPLQDWTPQDIGTMSMTAIPNSTNNIEMGFMGVYKRPSLFTVDSIATSAHTPGSGNTSILQNCGCVARSLPNQHECQLLPGTHWPQRNLGLERRVLLAPLGRSGLRRVDFTRNGLGGLACTFGVEVINIDGGSINDIAVIANTDQAGVLGRLKGEFKAFLKWAAANDCAVWAFTMLPRSLRALTVTGITAASPGVATFSAAHGLTGPIRMVLTGVVGDSTMQNAVNGTVISAATVNAADKMNLVGVNTTGGTYTSGGTALGFSANELACITSFNAYIRQALAQYQTQGLFSLSDIEADVVATPASYLNAAAWWGSDFTHPSTGNTSAAGAENVARRGVSTKTTVPAASAGGSSSGGNSSGQGSGWDW